MSRFSLAQLLELTEHRLEVETRLVKAAQTRWLNARAHEARVARAGVAERERLAAALGGGLAGAVLAQRARAAAEIEHQRRAAAAAVAEAQTAWQARLEQWRQVERKVRAYKVIRARWLARQEIRERRTEQRVLDDWSNRNRLVARGGLR